MAGVQHVAVYVSSWRQGFRSFLGPHLARGAITALSFELPGLLGGVGGGGGAADHAGGGDGNDTAEARGTRLALAQAHCLTRHKDFAHWLLLLDLDGGFLLTAQHFDHASLFVCIIGVICVLSCTYR